MRLILWSSGDVPELVRGAGAALSASVAARTELPADWGGVHDALFCPHAGEAYLTIDAQIRAVELLSRDVESSPERAYVARCVEHLDRVRDALYELHFGALDARTRKHHYNGSPYKGSSLGSYLVAGHLWCRDMVEGLRRHVSPPRASGRSRAGALAACSSAYVSRYFEPLFGELVLLRNAEPDPDHALHPIWRRAERVHAEIIRLDWALDG